MDTQGIRDDGVCRRADADAAQMHGDWTVGIAETVDVRAECVAFGEQVLNFGRKQVLVRKTMMSTSTNDFDASRIHAPRASFGERIAREG